MMCLVVFAALVIVGAASGAVYAMMSGGSSMSVGRIHSGDLKLEVGQGSWLQTTPGVDDPAQGQLGVDPVDFAAMPGDTFSVMVPVTATLIGDNLAAAMTVDYTHPGEVDADVQIGFHVENDTGVQVAPASGQAQLGQSVAVPGLGASADGGPTHWRVVISVAVGGGYDWVDTDPSATAATAWDMGTLSFGLVQTRQGDGFTPTLGQGGES